MRQAFNVRVDEAFEHPVALQTEGEKVIRHRLPRTRPSLPDGRTTIARAREFALDPPRIVTGVDAIRR